MAENQEKQFAIQKIYLKDVSFETPNSPKIFLQTEWQPEVEVNLGSSTHPLENGLYEVGIKITVIVKNGGSTAYLAEVNQAGIFLLNGFSDQELGGMVSSFCPSILFPYAREAISDLVIKGGFPQFLLAPVNFDALYAQNLQQQQNAPTSNAVN